MTEIEIAVGKSKYKIQSPESERDKLLAVAEKLNERINNLSLSFRNIDEKTLLVICALTMQDELQNVSSTEEKSDADYDVNEQDIYDAVSENMENISDYLENLTKKIRNY